MRKMYINITTKVIVEVEEGVSLNETIDNLELDFNSTDEKIEVIDSQIDDFELTDSK